MAMTNSGGYGSRAYSYTVTETYTLEEAVAKAVIGGLDPAAIYHQVSTQVKGAIDRLAMARYKFRFSELPTSQQREVMRALQDEFKRAKEEREKPISIEEALQLAMEGKADDVKLFQALPEELRNVLDVLATSLGTPDFSSATPELRKQIIGLVLEMFRKGTSAENRPPAGAESGAEGAPPADEGLECHNEALALKSAGDHVAALSTMQAARNHLASRANRSDLEPCSATVSLLCNLSSAHANIGDWTADVEEFHAALAVAERGLNIVANMPIPPVFLSAVLWHNRGHAGWRLGEVTRDRAAFAQGIENLRKAGQLFKDARKEEAVRENAEMQTRALAAGARLGW